MNNKRGYRIMGPFIVVSLLCIISLSSSTAYADCQGCCSYHGGVCCTGGVTMCCDGSPLSDTCRNKGCNACPSNGSGGGGGDGGYWYDEEVTIRLYGVDCPESDQPYGGAATDFTADEVLGQAC